MATTTDPQMAKTPIQFKKSKKQIGCSQYSHNFTMTDGQEPHGNFLCDCKKKRYSEMRGK